MPEAPTQAGPLVQHPVEGSHGLMVKPPRVREIAKSGCGRQTARPKPPRVREIAQMLQRRLDELDAASD